PSFPTRRSSDLKVWRLVSREGVDIMTSKALPWGAVVTTIAVLAIGSVLAVEKDSGVSMGIPPRTVADYLHAVIMAHRSFYTIHIVNRLLQEGILDTSENWRATN